MMIESVEDIGGMPTKCVAFERGIGDDLSDVKILVLLIPGNPGIVEFYHEFLEHLSIEFKDRFPNEVIPIWGISHAGHNPEGLEVALPPLDKNPNLYSLQGQICHTAKFIDLRVPAHVKVILIGHSIGCYIGQEVIKAKPRFSAQVIHFSLLFPTIMKMRRSPNGKFYVGTQSLHWLLLLALSIGGLIPSSLRSAVVNFYLWLNFPKATMSAHRAILTLIQKRTFEKVLAMGDGEMVQVRDLDVTFLRANAHRIFAYFGAKDGWCPIEYVRSMTSEVPKLSHILCHEGIEHAFVLDSSRRMAQILAPHMTQFQL